jgi:Uma2 family endonuclease
MAIICTDEYTLDLVAPQLDNMTDDELFSFCVQNKDLRIERDESKQIIFMPLHTLGKAAIITDIIFELATWNRRSGKGIGLDSSAGFYLPDDSMRSPCVAWMSMEKWDKLSDDEKQKFPYTAPEFIAEVMSFSDNQKDAKVKMLKWIQNGVLLAWLIDPQKQEVYIYRPDNTVTKVQGFTGKLSGENVLDGFEFDLSRLG